MNSLKTMLIVVVLAVIAGAVYVSINNPEPVPPPGIAEGWSGPPNIEMPNAATSGFPPVTLSPRTWRRRSPRWSRGRYRHL